MRLLVHMGLHKTGSTYLQHVLNGNHQALLATGVYYEEQPGYPAHHFAAWDLLRGDPTRLVQMIEAAQQSGCHTTIFSSEDLEGLLFDENAAALLEEAASAAGAQSVEWHMCVRDTGAYFSSLHSQLQHHVYADPVAMLCEVLRDGVVMILDPSRGQEGTPFWCYCFDHFRYISAFAGRTAHPVLLHDFRDAQPFPGWGVVDAAGGMGAIRALPGADARNSRLSDAAVLEGYCEQVLRLLDSDEQRRLVKPLVEQQVRCGQASIAGYADVIGKRYAESTAAALRSFGYIADADQLRRASAV